MTARCDDLDAFFDRELAAEQAANFGEHLATCRRCQDALHGRMLEAAVVGDAKPSARNPATDELAPRRSQAPASPGRAATRSVAESRSQAPASPGRAATRSVAESRSRRRWGAAGGAVAVAAAVMLAWWVKRPHGGESQPEFAMTIDRGDTQVRGDVTVGDTIHATARGYRAIWIYRDDRELVLACPGGATCRDVDGAVVADLKLPSVGSYAIVMLSSTGALPAPHGSLDADVAGAVDAGAQYQIKQFTVR